MSALIQSPEHDTHDESFHRNTTGRQIVLLDDHLDKPARERLAHCRVAKRELVLAADVSEAMACLEEGRVDGVIANLRDLEESLLFLQQADVLHPSLRRFLCASAQETTPLIAEQHCLLPRTWDHPLIDDAVSRDFAIAQWAANPSLVSVIGYLQRIPTLPTIYTQITEALEQEDCSAEEIGRLISKEPAISAKLLQCVNSGSAGLSRRITSPREAVMFFGTKKVRSIVLLSSMFVQFDGAKCASFSSEQFFKKSMEIAAWASSVMMAETQDKKLADMAFTAGLLHNFGVFLLAANLPESYDQLLRTAAERKVPVDRIEMETYGATHCDVGGFILSKWGLPYPIVCAVAWHTAPYRSGDKSFSPLSAVHIANAVEGYVRNGVLDYDTVYAESLGLSEEKIENWARSLVGESLYW